MFSGGYACLGYAQGAFIQGCFFCCLAVIDPGLNMYCTVAVRVGVGLGVYSSFEKLSKRFLLRVGDVEGNGMSSWGVP